QRKNSLLQPAGGRRGFSRRTPRGPRSFAGARITATHCPGCKFTQAILKPSNLKGAVPPWNLGRLVLEFSILDSIVEYGHDGSCHPDARVVAQVWKLDGGGWHRSPGCGGPVLRFSRAEWCGKIDHH